MDGNPGSRKSGVQGLLESTGYVPWSVQPDACTVGVGAAGGSWQMVTRRLLCPGELLKVCRAALHMSLLRELSFIRMCIQAQTTPSAGQTLSRRMHWIWALYHPLGKCNFHHVPSWVRVARLRCCLSLWGKIYALMTSRGFIFHGFS